jgi:Domain of unknown function (DUF4167)
MQNGPRTTVNSHRPKRRCHLLTVQSSGRRMLPAPSRGAIKTHERYLALAQAQAQAGDIVGAENYYQHAEHYFRSMSSDQEAAPPVWSTRGADGKHDR